MNNYDLLECSVMGLADFIYYKSNKPPIWMNNEEARAWKIGRARAQRLCTTYKNNS